MSDFTSDFNACMSANGLPTPGQVADSVGDVLEFLHKLHVACESAGVEVDSETIGALIAAGAAVGIDEAVLAALGAAAGITVGAYIGACAGCVASVVASDILGPLLASADPDVQSLSQFAQLGGAQAATA
jgi:hypothetical protein